MTKEKVVSLSKYLSNLKDKLSNPVPNKHRNHPETYKSFLEKEIKSVSETLDRFRIDSK